MATTQAIATPGQYLSFTLSSQLYGIPIGNVSEINRVSEVTPVPKAPPFVAGVMNLRGKIIPVINLRLKFGMASTEATRNTCVIVVEAAQANIGVIVDSVNSVIELSQAQIEPAPAFVGTDATAIISGMGKADSQVIILLDISATFDRASFEQVIAFEEKLAMAR